MHPTPDCLRAAGASLRLFLIALTLAFAPILSAKAVIETGFEKGLPEGFVPTDVTATADTERAQSGSSSLKLTSTAKKGWGVLTFALDGKLDFSSNHEISLWVYVEEGARFSAFISADDGSGEPYIVVRPKGDIEPGKWCRLSGVIYAGDFRKNDRDFKLLVRTRGTCWVDDLSLRSGLPETPSQTWPEVKKALHAAADKRVSSLKPGGALTLDARNAVLVPDTARAKIVRPSAAATVVPAEGMLVFAIDAKEDLDLSGTLHLEPDADLRPGLRLTVLSDDTVVAAPAVKAESWRGTGNRDRPGPAQDVRGERPPDTVRLGNWRMAKGRHYIAVAGPHMRAAGTFARLELRAGERPAEKPLYTFGLFADTHLGFARITKVTSKLNAQSGGELEAALSQLKREDASFAIIAGDMTDNGRRSQFEDLARAIKNAGLPVYGCVGNHDTGRDSRADIAETLPGLFPDGIKNTDYTFSRPPLRFVVLDGSHWRDEEGKIHDHRVKGSKQTSYRKGFIGWLRKTLAADTETPTVIISHYQFYLPRGVSPVSGFYLGKTSMDKKLMAAIDAAPNVVATMNGHHHSNSIGDYNGITCMQNPAFAAWPNAYRVFRVYPDRMEWEVRQIPNRGLIRESANPKMALLWALSAFEDDLAGTIKLAPRKTSAAK